MKIDPAIVGYEAYNEKIKNLIAAPEALGFDPNIVAVAQYLSYFCPVNPPEDCFDNRTSAGIISDLAGIVDIDINTVTRLMLHLGYSIYYRGEPRWAMERALYDDNVIFD